MRLVAIAYVIGPTINTALMVCRITWYQKLVYRYILTFTSMKEKSMKGVLTFCLHIHRLCFILNNKQRNYRGLFLGHLLSLFNNTIGCICLLLKIQYSIVFYLSTILFLLNHCSSENRILYERTICFSVLMQAKLFLLLHRNSGQAAAKIQGSYFLHRSCFAE